MVKKIVEIPEAIMAGDLGIFISKRSEVDFLPGPFRWNCISFANSYINFLSDKIARSTLNLLIGTIFKETPFNSNLLLESRYSNKLSCKVIRIELFSNKSSTLIQLETLTSLYRLAF